MATTYARILAAEGHSPARVADLTAIAKRYARDFSRDVNKALAAKNVFITGGTWLATNGSFANGERGYTLLESGTATIRTFAEVRALAA